MATFYLADAPNKPATLQIALNTFGVGGAVVDIAGALSGNTHKLIDAWVNTKYAPFGGISADLDDATYSRLFLDNFLDSGNVTQTNEVTSRLFNVFNDEDFGTAISTAVTFGQSLNDELKHSLKKTMFVYQEFIKSAGSVMDKIAELIKGIAQRLAR